MEIAGNPDPLVAAAIIAAVLRLDEEAASAAAVPPAPPLQGRWVMAGLPRSVAPPHVARPAPDADGWSLDPDREPPAPQ